MALRVERNSGENLGTRLFLIRNAENYSAIAKDSMKLAFNRVVKLKLFTCS